MFKTLGNTSTIFQGDANGGHTHSPTSHLKEGGSGKDNEFHVFHVDARETRRRCGLRQCWYPMAASHWPSLLLHHNVSVTNRFITILNPISLGMELGEISHNKVSVMQHVFDKLAPTFHEPYFYGVLGALLTLVVFLFFSWCHLLKMLGRFRERYQLRHKHVKTKPKIKPKTITLKGTNHVSVT